MDDRLFNDAALLDDDIGGLLLNIRGLLYEVENELPNINGEEFTIDIYRLEHIHEVLTKVYDNVTELRK